MLLLHCFRIIHFDTILLALPHYSDHMQSGMVNVSKEGEGDAMRQAGWPADKILVA